MHVSVIISTFEAPAWLEKVLWGYQAQTHAPFEVLVADDGSGPETALVIERVRRTTNVPIEHVWHPHEGFGKCRILNQAIGRARGDYLIFTDGDCVPRADFVATHVALSAPGRGLSGGCVRLPMAASRALTEEDIRSGRCMRTAWLRAICLHLDHARPYSTAESWARNGAIRERTRRERLTWTPHGIRTSIHRRSGDGSPDP